MNSFDDWDDGDSEYWERHMGGPDNDYQDERERVDYSDDSGPDEYPYEEEPTDFREEIEPPDEHEKK